VDELIVHRSVGSPEGRVAKQPTIRAPQRQRERLQRQLDAQLAALERHGLAGG
jgi:hypothetical protein